MAKAKSKDKKKKKKNEKDTSPVSVATSLQSLSKNSLVADVVAAALVATAAALKDSKKARRLAEQAGDELSELAKQGSERGNAMWQLALDIGRRALETLGSEEAPKVRPSKKSK